MCMFPPPPITLVAGIRSIAKTAKTAPIAAAPMNPAENASAAPVAVASDPALDATADRMATPSAAPISWPVIRNPEATPAWEARTRHGLVLLTTSYAHAQTEEGQREVIRPPPGESGGNPGGGRAFSQVRAAIGPVCQMS